MKGRENIPQRGSVIIASNHLSYLDPPLLGWTVKRREIYFLAHEDLFHWKKGFSLLIRKYNAIPLKRKGFDRKAFRKAIGLIKKGEALVIFPEGGRSRIGRFLPPKPGLGLLALETHVPILPVRIKGSDHSVGSLLFRRKRIWVHVGQPLTLKELDLLEPEGEVVMPYKERALKISERIMERISELDFRN